MNKYFSEPAERRVTIFATIAILTAASIASPAMAKNPFKLPTFGRGHAGQTEPCAPSTEPHEAHARVQAKVLIKAPPEVVWESIHKERSKDPDLAYSKVLEQVNEHECKLEQKFQLIPVIGTSVCVMENKEVPLQRIDYRLLKSDRFKAMEGSWVLTPAEGGKATMLELSSHLDLGLPVPKAMMNSISTKKIEKRLTHVKEMAESMHPTQVAASKEHLPE